MPRQGILAVLALPALAWAADPPGPHRPTPIVVQDLLGADWKARQSARQEALRLGARVLPRVLEARAGAPLRRDKREPLDDVLHPVVQALAVEVVRPVADPAVRAAADGALGGLLGACDRERPDDAFAALRLEDLEDEGALDAQEPVEWGARRTRARRARGALLLLGPAVAGPLLAVPPVRDLSETRAVWVVVERLYQQERGLALLCAAPAGPGVAADPAAREAFRARYRGVLDLAAPLLQLGVRDPDPRVRAEFQALRDQALAAALPLLDSVDPEARAGAEEELFQLGPLAQPALERLASGVAETRVTPQVKDAALRLARRIRYDLSRELIRRIGDDLEGYEGFPFRQRRERVIELERLGGNCAVPALRALLREEPSDEIRTAAAVALFRLGDPTGPEWLALHGADVPLVRLSRRELSAIFMDQGLRNLKLERFERAEAEFKHALDLEPKNETAWYNLACTYARWGKVDAAIEHLRRAVENGFDDATHMGQDPDLDSLRQDPRFREIMTALEARKSGQ